MSTFTDIRVPDRFRPSGVLVAAAAALAVFGGVGWMLGGVSQPPVPVVESDSVTAVGDLRLELDGGWAPAGGRSGMRVEGGRTYAPIPGLQARALLVSGPSVDATLVPAALRAELPATLPAPQRATLGGLAAWSYGPLRIENRTVEVVVAPTTTGTLALTCSAPPASWNAALGCVEGVRSISSTKAKALAPAADLAFRQAAGPVLGALDRRRVDERRRLSRLRRPAARAAAANRLAAAHRAAAAELARFAVAGETAALVGALRDTAGVYDRFAVAARRNKRQRFIAARSAVARQEAALAAALKRVR